MRVVYGTHDSFRLHDTGPSHPERAARLEGVDRGVRSAGVSLEVLEPPRIERGVLERVHTPDYIDSIERFCRQGGGSLDEDTVAGGESWEASLRAAGAGPAAVDTLRQGRAEVAFLAVRPPGHHAEASRAMGFCLFNNLAVTARLLVDQGERVAVVDWDVHHGNGTQSSFEGEAEVLYVSAHEFPLYPGTGWVDEIGEGPGAGTTVNLPFPAGTGGDAYREAFDELVVPVVKGFAPGWLLISAGYDAHSADPLARIRLLASDYAAMGSSLRALVPPGRTILFLEGGYDLEALEQSVRATLVGLAGGVVPDEPNRPPSPDRAWLTLSLARNTIARFHDLA